MYQDNVIGALRSLLPADAILTCDAGTQGRGVYSYLRFGGARRLLGPLSGTMGWGIPAGVAAALRFPGRRVVSFVGDGAFLMTGAELLTAVRERLPVFRSWGTTTTMRRCACSRKKPIRGG